MGTFAVQIAKAFGADVVVDYTTEDLTRSGQRYALILDVAGNRSLPALRRVLAPDGIVVMAGAPKSGFAILARLFQAVVVSRFASQKMVPFLARINRPDLLVLKELIEDGKVTPVIDRTYPLSETPAALRYLEEGHAGGKVAITL